MKRKSIILAGLLGLSGLLGLAPAAQAAILTFEGDAVCANDTAGNGAITSCGNYVHIAQSYGDVVGVIDVSYSAPRLTDSNSLRWWDNSYNTLYGVAWADSSDGDSKARIDLKPLNGQAVMLTHFDMGAYPNTTRGTTITISDLSGNVLMSYAGNIGQMGNMPNSFDGNWTSASGIRIEWQDSAFNVGIDNITYQMTSAVPEPETYAMLMAGLAAVGWMARRRKA